MSRRVLPALLCAAAAISGCDRADAPPPVLAADQARIDSPPTSPSASFSDQGAGAGWFEDVTAATGIDFHHTSGTNEEKPFPAANGSGVGAFDYDLDGRCDLYFANGSPFPLDPRRAAPFDHCYRNLGGCRFVDVTQKCGLGHAGYSAGVAVGDYDSDGFPDLYVTCYGANVLYRNCGDGAFLRSPEAGADDERWAASAAFFDADDDGLLDLYVCNYAKWTWDDRRWCGDRHRHIREYCSPHSVPADDDVVFRNRGDGTFEDATTEMGFSRTPGRAQGVVVADVNGDGLCDVYVGNDLQPNFLFINLGGGRFRDATESSGAAYDHQGRAQAGMGVDAADVNGDGKPELFVTNFSREHNALYDNLGRGAFLDATLSRGVYRDGLPYVGWGTSFMDFNLDGWNDLVVTNGPLRADEPEAVPPLLWENTGGRFRFVAPAEAGSYFGGVHDGRGLATADFDDDGDVDVVVAHHDAPPAVLQNTHAAQDARSITLRLVGAGANRDAVGAAVTMDWGAATRVTLVKGGGSYLSASEYRRVVATPPEADSVSCEIRWPGGMQTRVKDLRPGASYVIIQPRSTHHHPHTFEAPR
ncbi:MAG: VCBS repeat-containing protein [Planctomycetes bacterium]|nr:VCBS repeat-containing protein [Planctomycetota bacterium]